MINTLNDQGGDAQHIEDILHTTLGVNPKLKCFTINYFPNNIRVEKLSISQDFHSQESARFRLYWKQIIIY